MKGRTIYLVVEPVVRPLLQFTHLLLTLFVCTYVVILCNTDMLKRNE